MTGERPVVRDGDAVTPNAWESLRRYTTARIGLGRAGVSLPTRRRLEFQLAHAAARDAVHGALDADRLAAELGERGIEAVVAESQARNRQEYLLRPDLGRRLSERSRLALEAAAEGRDEVDLAVVVADGLSATAAQTHAIPVLDALLPEIRALGWSVAPVTVVEQGRVAIADEIGAIWRAAASAILIGERPGLSAPDSLGIYVTLGPRIGRTDAERNCVSNVRAAGLGHADAAATTLLLLTEARRRGASGVTLKVDDSAARLRRSRGNETLPG